MLKKIFSKVVIWSGLLWLYKRLSPNTLTVLTYHRIACPDGYLNGVISANPKSFEQQMEYLCKHCNVIDFDDLYEIKLGRKEIPPDAVIITFDDGYLDNYINAYPVLKRLGLKATISLITGYIGKDGGWWDKVGYMFNNTRCSSLDNFEKVRGKTVAKIITKLKKVPDKKKSEMLKDISDQLKVDLPHKRMFLRWSEIKKMSDVITYAAHTVNHPILTRVGADRAVYEVIESKKEIEKRGYEVKVFTYPNGSPDDMSRMLDMFLKENFRFALSTVYGKNKISKNLFKLRRVGIQYDDDIDMFRIKLTGFCRLAALVYERLS